MQMISTDKETLELNTVWERDQPVLERGKEVRSSVEFQVSGFQKTPPASPHRHLLTLLNPDSLTDSQRLHRQVFRR